MYQHYFIKNPFYYFSVLFCKQNNALSAKNVEIGNFEVDDATVDATSLTRDGATKTNLAVAKREENNCNIYFLKKIK